MSFLLAALMMFQAAPATGSISGTVVLAGSTAQAPIVMARVELSGGPTLPRVVRTDGEGRFAFADLPPGSYLLHVTKDSFIRQEYSKRAAIVIKPGETHKPVVFAMELAPIMAGRIQSEFGEPIANIQVKALKAVYGPDGKRTFTPFASTLSDDHGGYRLYWLDPGEYIISASFVPPVKTPGNPNEPVDRVVYAPTYYPNASEIANAQRIPLKADQSNLTLDFRLVRVPAVAVRGSTEKLGTGRSTGIMVTLALAGDSAGTTRYAAKSNDLGNFEIRNVAPGSYIASAETVVGTERYVASKHVLIHDRDENNVDLILGPGVLLQGRIALETGAPVDLGAIRANLLSTDPDLESFTASSIQPDGQFAIRNVQPGAYSLDIAGIPEDLYIKSLPAAPIGIAWDAPMPFEVLLGTDGGRIEGAVADRDGKPFAGAQVVLVPNATLRDRSDQYRVTSSDEYGQFALRGIPPGAYQIYAWEDTEERAWMNADFMANYRDVGASFTVPANARGTVTVPLIPEKP